MKYTKAIKKRKYHCGGKMGKKNKKSSNNKNKD
jgi:hypothetical protein